MASSRLNASGEYQFKAVPKLVERELYKLTRASRSSLSEASLARKQGECMHPTSRCRVNLWRREKGRA